MTIHVKNPGMLTTVQDVGRYGYAHVGISPGGAADAVALRIANRLVGNAVGAAALEMTLLGATLEFEKASLIAVAGGEFECIVGSSAVSRWTAIRVKAGDVLSCGPLRTGARAYLAVRGGFEVPEVLASASTNLNGRFGGFEGRALRRGDVLRVGRYARGARASAKLTFGAKEMAEQLYPRSALRVTRGVQADWFAQETLQRFLSSPYRVSDDSNRSGLRLQGEPVELREKKQLVTEGVPLGAVQVPADGQPIILFVDQQTTGGYPKIANVIAADMHRLGQLRPRDEVAFGEVTMAQAVQLLREQEKWLKRLLR